MHVPHRHFDNPWGALDQLDREFFQTLIGAIFIVLIAMEFKLPRTPELTSVTG
jgi:hypothetical protein